MTPNQLRLTKAQFKQLSETARIRLSEKERPRIRNQLLATLKMVLVLRRLEVEKVPLLDQVTGLENVCREDKARPSLSVQEALSGAIAEEKGFLKIEPIF